MRLRTSVVRVASQRVLDYRSVIGGIERARHDCPERGLWRVGGRHAVLVRLPKRVSPKWITELRTACPPSPAVAVARRGWLPFRRATRAPATIAPCWLPMRKALEGIRHPHLVRCRRKPALRGSPGAHRNGCMEVTVTSLAAAGRHAEPSQHSPSPVSGSHCACGVRRSPAPSVRSAASRRSRSRRRERRQPCRRTSSLRHLPRRTSVRTQFSPAARAPESSGIGSLSVRPDPSPTARPPSAGQRRLRRACPARIRAHPRSA